MDTIHCINNETWELYAANKLAEKELAALQKHANTCELCSDIKEGIDAMPKPDLLGVEVEKLNKKVDKHLAPPQRKRMPIWYWSAAAALLISLGIGFIYTRTNTNDVALVTPAKNTEQPYIDTTNTIEKIPIISTPNEQDATIKEKVEKNETREAKERNNDDIDIATGGVDLDIKKEDSKTKKDKLLYKKEGEKVIVDDFSKSVEVTKEISTVQRAEVVTPANKDMMKREKKQKMALPSPQMNNMFNNNNFNNNLGLNNFDFKQPLDSLNYNTALLAFTNDSLAKCILSLSYIVQDVNSKFYEDGLLLQAKTFIKQNKKEEAKAILKKAIALKGKRKREAKKLLRKLK